MRRFRLFLLAVLLSFIALAAQGVLIAIGFPVALTPELILLLVVFSSFYEASPYGAVIAFLCGLIVDVSTGQLLGPWSGAYVLSFGLVALISDRIYLESGFSLVAVSIFMTIFSHVMYLAVSVDPIPQLLTGWSVLLGKACSTALVAPLLFPVLRRILLHSRYEPVRSRGWGT